MTEDNIMYFIQQTQYKYLLAMLKYPPVKLSLCEIKFSSCTVLECICKYCVCRDAFSFNNFFKLSCLKT